MQNSASWAVSMVVGMVPPILILLGCIEFLINTRSAPAIVMLVGSALALLARAAQGALTMSLIRGGAPNGFIPLAIGTFGYVGTFCHLVFAVGFIWMAVQSARHRVMGREMGGQG